MKGKLFESFITIKSKRNHRKIVKRNKKKHRRIAGYQKFLFNAKQYAVTNHTSNVYYKKQRYSNANAIKFINKLAPVKFNLQYENCVSVIKFINELKAFGKKGSHININMENVVEIGNGAISMLLSVIYDLGNNGIFVKGTKPKNKEANAILEKSGFFKYIRTIVSAENSNSKNRILRTGDNKTPSTELAEEVRKSMETVWGINARCPRLYGGIFEMVRNSCDHAFKNSERTIWHLGLTHIEEENRVKFSFVDNGKGIIRTFLSGILKNVLNLFKDNTDILETAFSDGIESRTGLSWRGKGLPSIYEMRADNIISKLIVITNDVYIDFDEKIHVTLPVSYSGTYYYWEIDQNCTKSYFE